MFGLVLVSAWALAILLAIVWTESHIDDIALGVLGIPLVIYGLHRQATRMRSAA